MRDELPHPAIKHVVVLMLEGRGFDHLMGWLYDKDEAPHIDTRPGDRRRFLGLSTLSEQQLVELANPLPDGSRQFVPTRGARSPCTPAAAGSGFVHTMRQMWGVTCSEADWKSRDKRSALLEDLGSSGSNAARPPMTGYVLDHVQSVGTDRSAPLPDPTEILDTYAPEQLPVLSGLARYYALSDEWYGAVPGQGSANRAFALAGTSRGMVDDGFYAALAAVRGRPQAAAEDGDALPASTRSVFEVLQQFGFSWKVYWQGPDAPRARTLLPLLHDPGFNACFVQFNADESRNPFFDDARAGRLPALSWVEPRWTRSGGPSARLAAGNDMSPGTDIQVAEDFVADVYQALAAGPAWPHTLLLITFAGHGGTYDHLPPPSACPSANDRVPLPGPTADTAGIDPELRTQFGFGFSQHGPRVPTLLVSPRVRPGTVFRSRTDMPLDHASIPATLLTLARVEKRYWQLGRRVSKAPTFDHLLQADAPATGTAYPGQALNAGPPAVGLVLQYHCDYLFEYHDPGRAASVGEPRLYLGAAKTGSTATAMFFHPQLTPAADQAIRFRLLPRGGGGDVSPVLNLALVQIATTAPPVAGFHLLSISSAAPCAYFARSADAGAQWQVQALVSRDRRRELRTDDTVSFLHQAPSGQGSVLRLQPQPDDPGRLGAVPGQAWGCWRLKIV